MLNLFILNQNDNKIKSTHKNSLKKTSKHFSSPLREWKNNIYVYNKNGLNLIPSTTVSVTNIIKSYFSLFNKKLEMKMRTKRLLLRFRKLSSNKFYVSNGGFKHTNNKVIINLHVFNRQKINYLLTLKKWYLKKSYLNNRLVKRVKLIEKKKLKTLKDKYLFIRALNSVCKNKKYKLNSFRNISAYIESFYKDLIRKSLKKIRMYYYYRQLLYINKSKLNYNYLQYLKKHLEIFYNKNVEFNIINIKRFYLNSDILFSSITTKLSKNRRKMLRYLNTLKDKVKVIKKKSFLLKPSINFNQNLSANKSLLQNHIIDNLKYKHVTGFRLEAKGRLSKRNTASRSVSRLKCKGNLLDMDCSYKGLSCLLLKGNLKSNIQYTKLKSKTRIGSFGIKGWVSGY